MKKIALYRFILVYIIVLIACITEYNAFSQTSKLNWGVRLGLNAISIRSYEAFQADELLPNLSYTNKNGYLINAFARFNMNRLFMQPELGWNMYHRSCAFSIPIPNSNSYYSPVDLKIDSKAINANYLLGYNIVSDYPFLFGVFVGSSFTGTYHTNYSLESNNPYTKTGLQLNFSGIIGLSINISRIYFDLRYESSLPNANLKLKTIPDFPDDYQNVKIKKTEAILSFSCGVMF